MTGLNLVQRCQDKSCFSPSDTNIIHPRSYHLGQAYLIHLIQYVADSVLVWTPLGMVVYAQNSGVPNLISGDNHCTSVCLCGFIISYQLMQLDYLSGLQWHCHSISITEGQAPYRQSHYLFTSVSLFYHVTPAYR